jgi:hypothetical protein
VIGFVFIPQLWSSFVIYPMTRSLSEQRLSKVQPDWEEREKTLPAQAAEPACRITNRGIMKKGDKKRQTKALPNAPSAELLSGVRGHLGQEQLTGQRLPTKKTTVEVVVDLLHGARAAGQVHAQELAGVSVARHSGPLSYV